MIYMIMEKKKYTFTHKNSPIGYYGEFGGAYIPEILHGTVEKLKTAFYSAKNDDSFKEEYADLLKNYVGRPSPLYFAKRLSEKYETNIYLIPVHTK